MHSILSTPSSPSGSNVADALTEEPMGCGGDGACSEGAENGAQTRETACVGAEGTFLG